MTSTTLNIGSHINLEMFVGDWTCIIQILEQKHFLRSQPCPFGSFKVFLHALITSVTFANIGTFNFAFT
jgi:hypothetical protein